MRNKIQSVKNTPLENLDILASEVAELWMGETGLLQEEVDIDLVKTKLIHDITSYIQAHITQLPDHKIRGMCLQLSAPIFMQGLFDERTLFTEVEVQIARDDKRDLHYRTTLTCPKPKPTAEEADHDCIFDLTSQETQRFLEAISAETKKYDWQSAEKLSRKRAGGLGFWPYSVLRADEQTFYILFHDARFETSGSGTLNYKPMRVLKINDGKFVLLPQSSAPDGIRIYPITTQYRYDDSHLMRVFDRTKKNRRIFIEN